MSKNDLVAIRTWEKGDEAFIFSSWLKGLRYGNTYMELIDSKAYYYHYHKYLERILGDPRTIVLVACLADDPETILGFSVQAGPRLDWVFVKKSFRNMGIAKSLVPNNIETVSHVTDTGRAILLKHPGIIFNPFI